MKGTCGMDEPKLPCQVEGCAYLADGCGLAKLTTTVEALQLWDDEDPVMRLCFAMQATEAIFAAWPDTSGTPTAPTS